MSFTKFSRNAHLLMALVTLAIAITVMLGWILEKPDLIQIRKDFAPMVFNTAVGLALLAFSFLFSSSSYVRLGKFLAGAVFLLGTLTLLQYFIEVDLGIDRFLYKPFYNISVVSPGRMAVSTAICFMIFGISWFSRKPGYSSQVMTVTTMSLVIGFALIGLLGYLGGFNSEYGWGSFSRMAVHTSVSFLLLGLATLWQLRLEVRQVSMKQTALVPFYVIIIGVLTSVCIWQLLILRDQERNRAEIQIRLENLKANIDNVFAPLEKALEHMARRFSVGAYANEKMWLGDAESYITEFQGLRRLFWADEDHFVKWIHPMPEGGLQANTRVGASNKELSLHLKEIINGKKVSLSKVFEFPSGGKGFVFFVPIFKDKRYRGAVAAVLLSEPFFGRVLKMDGYDIEVMEDGTQVYQRGIPDPVFARDWTSRGRYTGLDVLWDLKITPTPAVVRANTSSLPGVVLLFGVSVSVLLGLALNFYNRAKDSEREAKEAFEWKEAGMNSVPLLIISLDENLNVREMNAAAERLLGYKTSELAGKTTTMMFYDPAEVRAFQQKIESELGRPISIGVDYMQAMFQLGYNRASEWTQVAKNGERYTVIISISEIHDEYGQVTGYLQILEDVTALKEKERLLKEQELKIVASSRLASLGEMAAGIAHEINNPLAIIGGHVGILRKSLSQKGLGQDQDLQKKIDAIEVVVQRIAKIIKGLSNYSRQSEPGTGDWIRVETMIEDTLAFCEDKFRIEGVELATSVSSDLKFKVQPYQISQVLLNLLNNALDAVQGSREKRVAVEAVEKDEGIEISVSDTGPGIPSDLRSRIMQPFFTTKEVGKGVGLGLSISMGIVQAHAGKFYLDENSARTRFVVWLPKDSKPTLL